MCACIFSTYFSCNQHHIASVFCGLQDISHTHGLTYPASLLLDQESFPSEAVYLRKADSGINSLVHRSKTLCCFLHFGCGKA